MKIVWLCVVLAVTIDALPANYVPIKPFKHYGPPRISSVKEFFSTTEKHYDVSTTESIITKIPDVVSDHVFVSTVEIPKVPETHSDVVHKYPGSTKPLVVFSDKQIIKKKPETPVKEYGTPIKHNEVVPAFIKPLVPEIPVHHVDVKTPEIPQKVYGVPDKQEEVVPVPPAAPITIPETKPEVPAALYGVPVEIMKAESNKKTFSPPKGFYRTPAHTNAPAVKLSEIEGIIPGGEFPDKASISEATIFNKPNVQIVHIHNATTGYHGFQNSDHFVFNPFLQTYFNQFKPTTSDISSIVKHSQISHDKSVSNFDHFASNPFLQSHFSQIIPATSGFSSAVKPAEVNYEKTHSGHYVYNPYFNQNQAIIFKPVIQKPTETDYQQIIVKPYYQSVQPVVHIVHQPVQQSVVVKPIDKFLPIIKPIEQSYPETVALYPGAVLTSAIAKPVHDDHHFVTKPGASVILYPAGTKPLSSESYKPDTKPITEAPYPAEMFVPEVKPVVSTMKPVEHHPEIIPVKPEQTLEPVEHHEAKPVAPYPAAVVEETVEVKHVEHHQEIQTVAGYPANVKPLIQSHVSKPIEIHDDVKPVGPYPALGKPDQETKPIGAVFVKEEDDFKPIEPVGPYPAAVPVKSVETVQVAGYPAHVKPLVIENHETVSVKPDRAVFFQLSSTTHRSVPATFTSEAPFDSSVFETTPKPHAPAIQTFIPSPSKLIIAPPPAPPKPSKIVVHSNPFVTVQPENNPYVISLHKHPEESHEDKKQTYPASSFSHSRPEEFHVDDEAPYPPSGVPDTSAPYPAPGEPQL